MEISLLQTSLKHFYSGVCFDTVNMTKKKNQSPLVGCYLGLNKTAITVLILCRITVIITYTHCLEPNKRS